MKRDPMWPVLGSDDLDAMLKEQRELAIGNGKIFNGAEIVFACMKHPESGMWATYENGVMTLACMECGTLKGQFFLTKRGSPVDTEYKH